MGLTHSQSAADIARGIVLRGAPEVPPDVAQMGAVGQIRVAIRGVKSWKKPDPKRSQSDPVPPRGVRR